MPLVADTSSDMFSRPIDVAKYGLIYAGAQKNLGPVRRHAGDRPRGPAGALGQVAAHDAELRRARRERLDVQHAAVLRHLPDGPGDEVGAGAGRARRRSARATSARRQSSTPRSTAPASIAAPPPKDSRSRMNVTFRLPSEELEKTFVKESTAAGPRRPEGPPLGRRHARVDLQRVPRRRGRRARRVHARVRTDATAEAASSVSCSRGRLKRRRRRRRPPPAASARRRRPRRGGGARRRRRAARRSPAPAAAELASMKPRQCSTISGARPWISSQVSASSNGPRCISARLARGDDSRSSSRRCTDSSWRSRSVSRRATGSRPILKQRLGRPGAAPARGRAGTRGAAIDRVVVGLGVVAVVGVAIGARASASGRAAPAACRAGSGW